VSSNGSKNRSPYVSPYAIEKKGKFSSKSKSGSSDNDIIQQLEVDNLDSPGCAGHSGTLKNVLVTRALNPGSLTAVNASNIGTLSASH
jgi:hypothetical protein